MRVLLTNEVLGLFKQALRRAIVLEAGAAISPLELRRSSRALALRVNVLFDHVEAGEALGSEELELFDNLAQHALLYQVGDDLLMLLFSAEASEYLHRVNNVALLFGSLAFELLRALDVK